MTVKHLLNQTALTKYGKLFSALNMWKKLKVMKLVFNSEIVEVVKDFSEGKEKLWMWFGIDRSSFVVMPRVLMCEMPDEWQYKMAELLEEWEGHWDFSEQEIGNVGVKFTDTKTGRIKSTPDWFLNYRHPDKEFISKLKKK